MVADRPDQPIDYKLKSLLLRPKGLPKIRNKEGLKKRLFLLLTSLHREVLKRIRDDQLKVNPLCFSRPIVDRVVRGFRKSTDTSAKGI
jgi:hypothetical protein